MDTTSSQVAGKTATSAASGLKTVHVNGEARQTGARTLAELIEEAGYGAGRIATAVNGSFIPARRRADTALGEGDHVEIVAPRQGG
jgi:sulfur carrier protein